MLQKPLKNFNTNKNKIRSHFLFLEKIPLPRCNFPSTLPCNFLRTIPAKPLPCKHILLLIKPVSNAPNHNISLLRCCFFPNPIFLSIKIRHFSMTGQHSLQLKCIHFSVCSSHSSSYSSPSIPHPPMYVLMNPDPCSFPGTLGQRDILHHP